MSAILYGNLSVEIASNRGARIERATLRQAATDMLRPQRSEARPGPLMLGRERESADAFAAIGSGRPVGFQAACGYGKTTLLQHIAESCTIQERAGGCVVTGSRRSGRGPGSVPPGTGAGAMLGCA